MRIWLEKRQEPSKTMQAITPVAAVVLTMLIGAIIFWAIGYDVPRAVKEIFFTPILASYKWSDVGRRAAPLILIALGLCMGNRAKVWNIGAEGQYIVGALGGAGIAYMTQGLTGWWIIPLMMMAGIVAGAAWAAVPAFLKTHYRVNEILSSLMLVYVASQLLNYLVTGPWKDPNGHNFPQTAPFTPSQMLPKMILGTPFPPGLFVAFALAVVFWIIMSRSEFGLGIRVVGDAPARRVGGIRRDAGDDEPAPVEEHRVAERREDLDRALRRQPVEVGGGERGARRQRAFLEPGDDLEPAVGLAVGGLRQAVGQARAQRLLGQPFVAQAALQEPAAALQRVQVAVDQAGHHGATVEVDDGGAGTGERAGTGLGAGVHDPAVAHGECLDDAVVRIGRVDPAVAVEGVGGDRREDRCHGQGGGERKAPAAGGCQEHGSGPSGNGRPGCRRPRILTEPPGTDK